jgi:hypothetical protein
MNFQTEILLTNLKILSSLKPNDKLITCASIFEVQGPSYTRAVYRYVVNEGRSSNLLRIREVVLNSIEAYKTVSSEVERYREILSKSCFSESVRYKTREQQSLCKRFLASIRESRQGILSLKTTYQEDNGTSSLLDSLTNTIDDFLENVNRSDANAPSPPYESRPPSPISIPC